MLRSTGRVGLVHIDTLAHFDLDGFNTLRPAVVIGDVAALVGVIHADRIAFDFEAGLQAVTQLVTACLAVTITQVNLPAQLAVQTACSTSDTVCVHQNDAAMFGDAGFQQAA